MITELHCSSKISIREQKLLILQSNIIKKVEDKVNYILCVTDRGDGTLNNNQVLPSDTNQSGA